MQSFLRGFWPWDTSQGGGWQNNLLTPIHPVPTLAKRRPTDKRHQEWLVLQASSMWWRGPVPSQPLRPVSPPNPARSGNAGQKWTIFCFYGDQCLHITSGTSMAQWETESQRWISEAQGDLENVAPGNAFSLLSSGASSCWPQIGLSLHFTPCSTSWILIQDHIR
jgi:hypothetical protein